MIQSMSKWILRGSIVAYVVCAILIFSGVFHSSQSFSREASDYFAWWSRQSQGQLQQMANWIGAVAIGFSALSAIGLLFSYPMFRLIFLLSILVMFLSVLPGTTPMLVAPIENFFDSLASFLSGLILAIAYCPALEKQGSMGRSEEHTSELQSQFHLVC